MVRYLLLVWRYVLLLLLCALTASFVLSNDTVVGVALYPFPYKAELPLFALAAMLLIGGFFGGMAFASIRHTARHIRLRRELKHQTAKSRALEQQVSLAEIGQQAKSVYAASPAPAPRIARSL